MLKGNAAHTLNSTCYKYGLLTMLWVVCRTGNSTSRTLSPFIEVREPSLLLSTFVFCCWTHRDEASGTLLPYPFWVLPLALFAFISSQLFEPFLYLSFLWITSINLYFPHNLDCELSLAFIFVSLYLLMSLFPCITVLRFVYQTKYIHGGNLRRRFPVVRVRLRNIGKRVITILHPSKQ